MSEVEIPNPDELEEAAGKRFSKRVALLNGFLLLFTLPFLGP